MLSVSTRDKLTAQTFPGLEQQKTNETSHAEEAGFYLPVSLSLQEKSYLNC